MAIDRRVSAWALILCFVTMIAGGLIGHMSPPPAPTLPAAQVVEFYKTNSTGILVFAVMISLACCFAMVAYSGLTVAMRRMQPKSLFLPLVHLLGCIFAIVGPFLSTMVFAAAAYRPDAGPELIVMLNDLGVMFYAGTCLPALVQAFALGTAILRDDRADPVFPRWLAWVYFWYGTLSQPGLLALFFMTGPFAFDGAWGFLSPLVVLVVWLLGTAIAMFRLKPQHWLEAEAA